MNIYMVGGAVRDKLMGLTPKDVDYVVVGATPEDMLQRGYKQVGADFPVFLDDDGVEYALARTERKNGHGYNGFSTDHSPTTSLEDDLMRRDLSINAMAMGLDMEAYERGDLAACPLFDPFGGQSDLMNKVLRHVSPAFADDPVRVLRLARFHARYGPEWSVHPDTLAFCKMMVDAGELAYLTRERVLKEMEKALTEQSPHLFFETLEACGALSVVFPELNKFSAHMTMLLFPSRSGRFNYAKLSVAFKDVDAFEKRMNVSVEWVKFARMFRAATVGSREHPVDALYKMDAYRQHELWNAVVAECDDAECPLSMLSEAYELTKHINFDSLPVPAGILQGKQISEAIHAVRKAAFDARP